jgi:hypothetical protein
MANEASEIQSVAFKIKCRALKTITYVSDQAQQFAKGEADPTLAAFMDRMLKFLENETLTHIVECKACSEQFRDSLPPELREIEFKSGVGDPEWSDIVQAMKQDKGMMN